MPRGLDANPQDHNICQDAQALRWILQFTSRCFLAPLLWVSWVLGRALSLILCCWDFFYKCRLPHESCAPFPPLRSHLIPGSPSCSTAAPPLRPRRVSPFLATPSPRLEVGVCAGPPHALHHLYHDVDSPVYDYLGTMHPDALPVSA
ncbi:hypothetical protein B0H11DRAFT_2285178 [Mycena galericulata]|nr:hypothetical protein B0H11DRAFT_2285178 [Mycena galericulata]